MTTLEILEVCKTNYPDNAFSAFEIGRIIGQKTNITSIRLHQLVKQGHLGKFCQRNAFMYYIPKEKHNEKEL